MTDFITIDEQITKAVKLVLIAATMAAPSWLAMRQNRRLRRREQAVRAEIIRLAHGIEQMTGREIKLPGFEQHQNPYEVSVQERPSLLEKAVLVLKGEAHDPT